MTYMITINSTYYPEVEYRPTIEDAKIVRDNFIRDNDSKDGKHKSKVTISMVIETTDIKTDY